MKIEELEPLFSKYMISKKYLKILKDKGINTVEDLVFLNKENLMYMLDTNEEIANRIIQVAWRVYKPTFLTAEELEKEEMSIKKIETPLPTLNKLLNGGFEVGSLVEFFGSYASGKTQFLFTQSVLETAKGNLVIFVDTEGTFKFSRLKQIAEARGYDSEILKNLLVKKASSSNELIIITHNLFSLIDKFEKTFGKKVSLVCLDSIINPFRADYIGISELAIRQQRLNFCLRTLLKIAQHKRLVVMFSNQVIGSPKSVVGFVPAGGHVLAHISSIRFGLYKRGNYRILRIEDSPSLPRYEILFRITDAGVEEVRRKRK